VKQGWKTVGVLFSANMQIIFVGGGLYKLAEYLRGYGVEWETSKKTGAILLLVFAGYSYFKFFKYLEKD
jgi:hypothetical protein